MWLLNPGKGSRSVGNDLNGRAGLFPGTTSPRTCQRTARATGRATRTAAIDAARVVGTGRGRRGRVTIRSRIDAPGRRDPIAGPDRDPTAPRRSDGDTNRSAARGARCRTGRTDRAGCRTSTAARPNGTLGPCSTAICEGPTTSHRAIPTGRAPMRAMKTMESSRTTVTAATRVAANSLQGTNRRRASVRNPTPGRTTNAIRRVAGSTDPSGRTPTLPAPGSGGGRAGNGSPDTPWSATSGDQSRVCNCGRVPSMTAGGPVPIRTLGRGTRHGTVHPSMTAAGPRAGRRGSTVGPIPAPTVARTAGPTATHTRGRTPDRPVGKGSARNDPTENGATGVGTIGGVCSTSWNPGRVRPGGTNDTSGPARAGRRTEQQVRQSPLSVRAVRRAARSMNSWGSSSISPACTPQRWA